MELYPENLTHDVPLVCVWARALVCLCVYIVLHCHHGLLCLSYFEYNVQPGRENTRQAFGVLSLHPQSGHGRPFTLTHSSSSLQKDRDPTMAQTGYFVGLVLYEPVMMPVTSDRQGEKGRTQRDRL